MDRKLINPAIVQDIADAIREKGGQTEPIVVNALGDAIRALPQGMGDNTTEVVEAISGEQPEGDIAIANAIAKGATDAAREHVWQGSRATDNGREVKDGVAFVSSLKGRSFKATQNVKNGDFSDSYRNWSAISASTTALAVNDGVLSVTFKTSPSTNYSTYASQSLPFVANHIYLVIVDIKVPRSGNVNIDSNKGIPSIKYPVAANTWTRITGRGEASADATKSLAIYPYAITDGYQANDVYYLKNVMYFDLTAMGMEDVVDADDFAHRLGYADAASLPYIPYGETIVNSKPTEVVSRGRNLWDEEWEKGGVSGTTGENVVSDATIRTKNYIPVDGNVVFINTSMYARMVCYDVDYNFLGECMYQIVGRGYNNILLSGTRFVKVSFATGYGTTYKNDICINYPDSSFDGQYAPYLHSVLPLPLSSILHEGQPLFPYGLCGIGDVKDEVDWAKGKAVKRIGVVDLGTLTWGILGSYINQYLYYTDSLIGKIAYKEPDKIYTLCLNYTSHPNIDINKMPDKGMRVRDGDGRIYINDIAYTLKYEDFVSQLQGVLLFYELAEPIEVTFDPAKAFYRVQNGGSEEAVMDGVSAPLVADIAYRDNMAFAEEAALLAFANERSGQNDTDLGDAIRTLSE